jgi:hypothetical protein
MHYVRSHIRAGRYVGGYGAAVPTVASVSLVAR